MCTRRRSTCGPECGRTWRSAPPSPCRAPTRRWSCWLSCSPATRACATSTTSGGPTALPSSSRSTRGSAPTWRATCLLRCCAPSCSPSTRASRLRGRGGRPGAWTALLPRWRATTTATTTCRWCAEGRRRSVRPRRVWLTGRAGAETREGRRKGGRRTRRRRSRRRGATGARGTAPATTTERTICRMICRSRSGAGRRRLPQLALRRSAPRRSSHFRRS
mmetsp:Transcript_40540/g.130315  ORF Transcript_40540/g.130315 Transcript_40540/m.130315 type:complete len:219 (+) Transcript_40540:331-987(+)